MKVLQLIQKKQYRGAEVFCCQLSSHLVALGHEVEVYSIYDGNAELPFYHGEVKSIDRHPGVRFLDYNGWKKLAEIINEFNPDVIQANAADTLKYAVMSRLVFRWKNPLLYRNASAFSFYARSWFSRGINSFLLKKVDKIISVSQASKNDLNELFPFTESKSSVIPVGVEKKTGAADLMPDALEGKLNIIHVGSFTKEKNHRGVLNIFKQVHSQVPDVRLHFLGEGPLRKEIQQKATEIGLKKYIYFHGEIKDPYPYLVASDVLILPSLIEGLPGVILEAMYSRVSVVAYRVGGIPEILNSRTGSIVEKNNEQAFIHAVVETLMNPDKGRIEQAHNMVQERFMNGDIAKKFIKVYSDHSRRK